MRAGGKIVGTSPHPYKSPPVMIDGPFSSASEDFETILPISAGIGVAPFAS